MTEVLWKTNEQIAWTVGYFDDPRTALRILKECKKNHPENTYYARIQIVGIQRKS